MHIEFFFGKKRENLGDLNTDDKITNTGLKNIRLEDVKIYLRHCHFLVEGFVKPVINFQAPYM
jgi:hypothetical protein